MAFCFYEHGILPREYLMLNNKDKALMLASIEHFAEQQKSKSGTIGNKESLI